MGITSGIPMALQVALFLALAAFTVLVACVLPVVFQVRRQMQQMMSLDLQLKAGLKVFLDDSHALLWNGNELLKQVGHQMTHLNKAIHTIGQWTERADRLVDQVSAAIEPPVLSLVRSIGLVRTGVASFLEMFGKSKQRNLTQKE
jgi:uncharacterized protein YoxC